MRFRYFLLCGLAALLLTPAVSAQADLILTGVVDGDRSGGVPKAVELYVVNDIADLSVYAVGSANNGGGTDGPEISLSGSATAGDFLYIASETPEFNTFFGFAPDFDASTTTNAFAVSVNGDDALELFYNAAGFPADLTNYTGASSVVDTFGDITHSGTLPWAYTDGWAYRMDATGPEGATFTLANWDYALNGLDGADTNANAPTPFPVGSYQFVVVAPTDPVISFVGSEMTLNEGETLTAQVQIDFGGQAPTNTPVTVMLTIGGGTADASDITGPTPASVTFTGTADGEIQTAAIGIVSGDGDEPTETITFGLSVTAGDAIVGSPSSYVLTILDQDAAEPVTFAEARAAGPGAFVTVVGTVTRSQGNFTYIQDETGGLSIREVSGSAFFDDVTSGAIAPGSRVTISGTLSEFRNLLQINEGDLDSYAVTGTAAIPTPQLVTLAQLAANGEDYESELVLVRGITIDGDGATEFAAARNYDVSEGGTVYTQFLRVPNAGDSEVDGTSIPTDNVNVTAIIGQFDTDPATGSTEGYQLLVIGASDVQAATADENGNDRPEAVLTVANPLQGASTIRFATGVAGRASLSLYDALGRQVVTLVDGAVDGSAQTVSLDAGTLASGVYVLRLQGEDVSISRTLTVVR